MVTETGSELEGPSGRCLIGLLNLHVQSHSHLTLYCQSRSDCRPKYDDLLSNPTSDAQAAGHTRSSAAYKAKVSSKWQ